MTDKALTPQQHFDEQMRHRIREHIGELLPDALLSEMVQKALQTLFFQPRPQFNSWHERIGEKPPLLEDILRELLTAQVHTAVAAWLARPDAAELIQRTIREALEQRAGELLLNAITRQFAQPLENLRMALETQLHTPLPR